MTDLDTNADSKTTPSSVLCSICLDEIADELHRSKAKLKCGHQFHLDCIGSAFNMKGAMQCPNCRKVERGRWLNASGPTRSSPEMSMDDRSLREDQYRPSYSEIPYWCEWRPYSGRVHSTFEVMESWPSAYHNLHAHQNLFAEHGAASPGAYSYVAYLGPIPSASSNTNEAIEDPNLSNHWNGVYNHHADMHYHNGVHHSHLIAHANSTVQAPMAPTLRSTRGDFGAMTRSGSHVQSFVHGHGGGRSHERSRTSQTIHHPRQQTNPLPVPPTLVPSMARFPGRTLGQPPVLTNSVSNRNGGLFICPYPGSSLSSSNGMENMLPVISFDRESRRGSFHNGADLSRTGNVGLRHWS